MLFFSEIIILNIVPIMIPAYNVIKNNIENIKEQNPSRYAIYRKLPKNNNNTDL